MAICPETHESTTSLFKNGETLLWGEKDCSVPPSCFPVMSAVILKQYHLVSSCLFVFTALFSSLATGQFYLFYLSISPL